MNNILEYKGYYGTVEISDKDEVLYGKIKGIASLVSYEGENIKSLKADFISAVDDYLEMCEDNDVEPEKAYKSTLNVRVSQELHKKLVNYSNVNNQTLNTVVERAISSYVEN